MKAMRQPLLMLLLLLFTSLSPLLLESISTNVTLSEADDQLLSEAERMDVARQLWSPLESSSVFSTDIQDASGVLRLQSGEFDPLISEGPSLDKFFIDLNDPASLFFTQVYLATDVLPPRQKITGFITKEGVVTSSPLLPDADFKQLNIQKGMNLTLEM